MLELDDKTTEINTSQNTGIIINEQFEPKQDRQNFQTGT